MFKFIKYLFIFVSVIFLINSCRKDDTITKPKPNQPPRTFLWIQTDTTQELNPTISRQIIRWWGEDPDGLIRGYLFAYFNTDSVPPNTIPDTLGYSWVVKNDTAMAFPLFTARERFTVIVRAVDNTFKEQLDVGAIVRLKPVPFWDKNMNKFLDNGDVELVTMKEAIDPTGAKQIFPIKNTPPVVEFAKDPLDPLKTIQQPDTTFPVATFSWVGTDLDGDQTIKSYRINLNAPNDTSRWFEFPAYNTMITIEAPRSKTDGATGEVTANVYSGIFPTMFKIGEVQGLKLNDTNRIYLQAKDLAGDFSPVVSLPSGNKIWYVKKPTSKLLVVSNYGSADLPTIIGNYRNWFNAIDTFPGVSYPRNFGNFDWLDIRRGATDTKVGDLVPPILNPAMVRTLLLFDYVFWFTDYIPDTWAHMYSVAQFPLYLYNGAGGKVVYTTRFGYYLGDPRGSLVDFAPVDLVGTTLIDTRIPNDWPVYPDSTYPSVLLPNPFPTMRFNPAPTQGGALSLFVRDIYKRADAKYILKIPPVPGRVPPNAYWTGPVNIGVIDGAKTFVFLSMPLHLMNGTTKVWPDRTGEDGKGVPAFLKRVFIDEFGG